MTDLITDILSPGARMGEFKTLDFGRGESEWRAAEGKRGSCIDGWREDNGSSVAFPESTASVTWRPTCAPSASIPIHVRTPTQPAILTTSRVTGFGG
ncbi:hypothetical protein [Burkholderia sp. BCC0397]|uniref:hypothetical protein n=1 Tax=Burkholderia sp. BCC0397 TaxID=486876 RepID=UPI00158D8D30|nr:hypothetical protein [Burkholderia sp. BCC0397]